ncbi:PREDICTED: ubiquitin-conjugating enzyme E2 T-like [Nanorana parkeri]|uniref:ubiquitin-conjugating enzyme E2 T-like n=1 Tax=Nanorana parkeri TaxID=125878 RepID=UPI0008545D4B|nr:PREDICTED: ubiquitin-conjugating enzyme E2 T-like [Nanorana parkeri]
MQRQTRLNRELQLLSTEPPSGVSCWQVGDRIDELRAQVVGAAGSPYEGGVFALEIAVPERYPFEPGAWRPALSLSSVLTSIQLLMGEPNPEDPLMADIAREYKYHRAAYTATARSWTQKHAGATHKRGGQEREEPAKGPCMGEEECDVTGRAE